MQLCPSLDCYEERESFCNHWTYHSTQEHNRCEVRGQKSRFLVSRALATRLSGLCVTQERYGCRTRLAISARVRTWSGDSWLPERPGHNCVFVGMLPVKWVTRRKSHNTMGDEGRPLLLDVTSNQMQPLPWDPRRAKISGVFILASVALERLAYYAVVMNLFLYLNRGQPVVSLFILYFLTAANCCLFCCRKKHGILSRPWQQSTSYMESLASVLQLVAGLLIHS